VLELGGVRDVLTKSIGTQNPIKLVKATMDGLMRLRRPEQVAELRGLTVRQVLGLDLQQEGAAQTAEGEAPVAEPVAVATAEGAAEATATDSSTEGAADATDPGTPGGEAGDVPGSDSSAEPS